ARDVIVTTNAHIDDPPTPGDINISREEERSKAAIDRCIEYHLRPALVLRHTWTPSDELIHTAIGTVATEICEAFFHARTLVRRVSPHLLYASARDAAGTESRLAHAVSAARERFLSLMTKLRWSTWQKCRPGCGVGEVCFVSMWPFGTVRDYYSPSCHS